MLKRNLREWMRLNIMENILTKNVKLINLGRQSRWDLI